MENTTTQKPLSKAAKCASDKWLHSDGGYSLSQYWL